jgi:hypothetical protein
MEGCGGEEADVVGLVPEPEIGIEPGCGRWRAVRSVLRCEDERSRGTPWGANGPATQARELPADRERREPSVPGEFIERDEPAALALSGIEKPGETLTEVSPTSCRSLNSLETGSQTRARWPCPAHRRSR